jgi:predicted nucleotidyltransferase
MTPLDLNAGAQKKLHLPIKYFEMVKKILHDYLPHAEIWAYGSRVNGDHYEASDLDLVARCPEDLNHRQENLFDVIEAFKESDLPIIVQIIDWAVIPETFRAEIEAAYILIQKTNI